MKYGLCATAAAVGNLWLPTFPALFSTLVFVILICCQSVVVKVIRWTLKWKRNYGIYHIFTMTSYKTGLEFACGRCDIITPPVRTQYYFCSLVYMKKQTRKKRIRRSERIFPFLSRGAADNALWTRKRWPLFIAGFFLSGKCFQLKKTVS